MARLPPVDHLVWGSPDLEREIDRIEELLGVRAVLGGRHPGEGTCNALLGLGPAMYLELVGPDPSQGQLREPRWFGLDSLTSPRLITWAAKSTDLEQRAASARNAGVSLGEIRAGRRELSNGRVLSWRLTYPEMRVGNGLVPFLIDWGDSPHPSDTAPTGVRLVDLRAEHPAPEAIIDRVRHLGLELRVSSAPAPSLIATLETPRGAVELR
jgi:hypothetical protein